MRPLVLIAVVVMLAGCSVRSLEDSPPLEEVLTRATTADRPFHTGGWELVPSTADRTDTAVRVVLDITNMSGSPESFRYVPRGSGAIAMATREWVGTLADADGEVAGASVDCADVDGLPETEVRRVRWQGPASVVEPGDSIQLAVCWEFSAPPAAPVSLYLADWSGSPSVMFELPERSSE